MSEFVIIQREDLRSEISAAIDKRFEAFFSKLCTSPAQQPPGDDLLSRKEAGQYLGVSLTTLWQWTNDGVITGYRISGRVRYKKSELEQALNKIKTRA